MATQDGFLDFIRNQMAIDEVNLPDEAPVIAFAYALAIEIVNLTIQAVSPTLYDMAVYNLAADSLINFAPDVTVGDEDILTFFQDLRSKWGIGNFTSGVVGSTNDVSTSASLIVQEAAHTFTLANLQNLKTPYGRQYLYIAQAYGTLWGLS